MVQLTSHHGNQEDPLELQSALLEKVRAGVRNPHTGGADHGGVQPMDLGEDGEQDDLVARIFEGVEIHNVRSTEEDRSASSIDTRGACACSQPVSR